MLCHHLDSLISSVKGKAGTEVSIDCLKSINSRKRAFCAPASKLFCVGVADVVTSYRRKGRRRTGEFGNFDFFLVVII